MKLRAIHMIKTHSAVHHRGRRAGVVKKNDRKANGTSTASATRSVRPEMSYPARLAIEVPTNAAKSPAHGRKVSRKTAPTPAPTSGFTSAATPAAAPIAPTGNSNAPPLAGRRRLTSGAAGSRTRTEVMDIWFIRMADGGGNVHRRPRFQGRGPRTLIGHEARCRRGGGSAANVDRRRPAITSAWDRRPRGWGPKDGQRAVHGQPPARAQGHHLARARP